MAAKQESESEAILGQRWGMYNRCRISVGSAKRVFRIMALTTLVLLPTCGLPGQALDQADDRYCTIAMRANPQGRSYEQCRRDVQAARWR